MWVCSSRWKPMPYHRVEQPLQCVLARRMLLRVCGRALMVSGWPRSRAGARERAPRGGKVKGGKGRTEIGVVRRRGEIAIEEGLILGAAWKRVREKEEREKKNRPLAEREREDEEVWRSVEMGRDGGRWIGLAGIAMVLCIPKSFACVVDTSKLRAGSIAAEIRTSAPRPRSTGAGGIPSLPLPYSCLCLLGYGSFPAPEGVRPSWSSSSASSSSASTGSSTLVLCVLLAKSCGVRVSCSPSNCVAAVRRERVAQEELTRI